MSETELPGKLFKLNITPVISHTKMNKNDNPFWGDTDVAAKLSISLPIELDCSSSSLSAAPTTRKRRSSESVLDDFRAASARQNTEALLSTRVLGVQKKSRNRKLILREPILRALRCLPPQTRRKLLVPTNTASDTSSLVLYSKTFGTMSTSTKQNASSTTAGISDFKDLISECQDLLENSVDLSKRLNESQKSKNFTTMRDSLNAEEETKKSNANLINSISSLTQNSVNSIMPNTPRTNNSSTCSQQAGNSGVANNDDVTINELAGYFETMVHIPKKMSSMAEMMYT